jgi:hypothetical protein
MDNPPARSFIKRLIRCLCSSFRFFNITLRDELTDSFNVGPRSRPVYPVMFRSLSRLPNSFFGRLNISQFKTSNLQKKNLMTTEA